MRLAFHRLTCYGLLRLVVQHEQMILSFIDAHGIINRTETIELCKLNLFQANLLLKKLRDNGAIEMIQRGKSTSYIRK